MKNLALSLALTAMCGSPTTWAENEELRFPDDQLSKRWVKYEQNTGGNHVRSHFFNDTVSVEEMTAAFYKHKDTRFKESPYACADSVVYNVIRGSNLLLTSPLRRHADGQLAQNNVSIEMMKERYHQYMKGDTVPIDSADEVVNCIYHPKKEFSNPRIDKSRTRNIHLLNLRTKEYPDRRHFWSIVIEQKRIGRKFNGVKVPKSKRRRTWTQHHKYFYLDSIAGMARDEIPQSIKDNYHKKDRLAYHAPALSGTFYGISDPLNMFGYITALYFVDLPLDKGKFMHGRLLSRCFSHRSLLDKNTMTICETSTACLQALMRTFSREITERYKAEAKDILPGEKKFDLLIYQNQDLTSDVVLLSDKKDAVAELETLRHIIRSLPANYFPRFWTLDNQALPGFYVEATLKNGEWTFRTNRFVKPY